LQNETSRLWQINQLFLFLGMLSVVFAVLKAASAVIVPILIAGAIAILLSPLFGVLERRRVPRIVALIFVIALSSLLLVALGAFLSHEVQAFFSDSGNLTGQIQKTIDSSFAKLDGFGIHLEGPELRSMLHPGSIIAFFQGMLRQLGNQLSNIFLIIFMAAFIVMDSTYMPLKLKKVFAGKEAGLEAVMAFIDKIKTYFLIKAKVSIFTAVWALGVLWYYDIPYLYLWAAFAFFLNFIPVIGSILAAVPPVIIALIEQGAMTGVWVALWYLVINIVMGNMIEPSIMGRGLGLSATTIFLSMTFWGWMFGPAGMILSVPLSMGFQFLMLQYEETKWVGFIMSDYKGETT